MQHIECLIIGAGFGGIGMAILRMYAGQRYGVEFGGNGGQHMQNFQGGFGGGMTPLAAWLTLSGIDDLALIVFWLWFRAKDGTSRSESTLSEEPERNLAIFTPLWQEDAVVRQMVSHNVTQSDREGLNFFI